MPSSNVFIAHVKTVGPSPKPPRAAADTAAAAERMTVELEGGQTAVLPPGVPSTLERHGLRIGVDLWLPVLR